MKTPIPQEVNVKACEADLELHGDSFRGAGYKSATEAFERYAIMLGVIRRQDQPATVLDLGCGFGHMLDYLKRQGLDQSIDYTGLDLSAKYLATAQRRHPHARFLQMDILESDADLPIFDYVILNGLFNYKGEVASPAWMDYWQCMLRTAYRHCRRGLAFNVMSRIVDWKRDDLFYLPFDMMADFVASTLSRYFIVRHDYAGYEYTTYVFRDPA